MELVRATAIAIKNLIENYLIKSSCWRVLATIKDVVIDAIAPHR